MKISNSKLVNSIEYINEINKTRFFDLDLSELFDDNKDLTFQQKEQLFWTNERLTNVEIISGIFTKKIKIN